MDKIELRVTRPWLYPRDCQNPEYMEGHYFRGVDYDDAKTKAEIKFPSEPLHFAVFKTFIDGAWVRVTPAYVKQAALTRLAPQS